jgi:hypothetical protein
MDGDTFREAVEASKRTQLDRLGSSKLLIALTGARIERERVLEVAAHSEHAARETFRGWAADEPHEGARAAFEAVAEQEDEHLERVLGALGTEIELADGGPMHAYLRGREDTVERVAGGMVGRPLVSLRTHTQIVGFFVNEADEHSADLFRELKSETAAVIDDGVDLLDDCCEGDDDWERARMVAEYTVQVAYDDYADALTGMGLGVKDIC